jgi:hypothetical protein
MRTIQNNRNEKGIARIKNARKSKRKILKKYCQITVTDHFHIHPNAKEKEKYVHPHVAFCSLSNHHLHLVDRYGDYG